MSNQKLVLENVFVNNLKGVDLSLESNQLIVFSGVSGSGKSSLAFDTIYLEGQRRYIESLAAHAKRVLKDLPRPKADKIEGISPTIAVEQKSSVGSVRSTVGTLTGVYDYLRILYARVGTPYCPESLEKVEPLSKEMIIEEIEKLEEGIRLVVLAPIIKDKKSNLKEEISSLVAKGFLRAMIDGEIVLLEEAPSLDPKKNHSLEVVIDRIVAKKGDYRLKEAVYSALDIGEGQVSILEHASGKTHFFSTFGFSKKSGRFYKALQPGDFSFNNVQGMCETCQGLGTTQEFDLDKIIDPEKSISEDCCTIASSSTTVRYGNIYRNLAKLFGFKLSTPWQDLSQEAKDVFLYGTKEKWTRMTFIHPFKKNRWVEYVNWKGVIFEANERFYQAKSDSYKKKMSLLMTSSVCPDCKGSRLKPYPSHVQVGGKTIHQVTSMPIDELSDFFDQLKLAKTKQKIANLLLKEITGLLHFLVQVGVGYLSLERISSTLSGGEAQRVKLASYLGCGLVGITYILDEPSIGLHQRDNIKLISALQNLKEKGNTIIVVEHDEETLLHADTIVDIGPGAGVKGGEVLFKGPVEEFIDHETSMTAQYLSRRKKLYRKPIKEKPSKFLTLKGASKHNLQDVELKLPLERLVTITGVSGSGKSTLILQTLYPAVSNRLNRSALTEAPFSKIEGLDHLDKVIAIDQTPIGRSPRSNPATYTKVFDVIRDLFTKLPESQAKGFKAGRFSFNVKEGSCPRCLGYGSVRVEMDFIEDTWIECPECLGKRFDEETLSVFYRGKNIADILNMSIEEAMEHFKEIPPIYSKLHVLVDVGLGYLKLSQSATTLSGGEAQRIKLSKELVKSKRQKCLYIFDEPTTGLHFHDISHLLKILERLTLAGHSLVIIEHNLDIVANSDYVIDLGPEGGKAGGQIIAKGTPKQLSKKKSPTGEALLKHIEEGYKVSSSGMVTQPQTDYIEIKNATTHNLQTISCQIPRNEISVFTGPSGSGKSSLVFDTLYAEGQRRYTDTLSTYLRTFIKQMPGGKVDAINYLLPSIAIEQKSHALNPRSTIGTLTEVYDFLRLLFSHVGVPHCPQTGEVIQAISKKSVTDRILAELSDHKIQILAPVEISQDLLAKYQRQGFLRARINEEFIELDPRLEIDEKKQNDFCLVIDRLICSNTKQERILEGIELAAKLADNKVIIFDGKKDRFFNLSFSVPSTGKSYPEITPQTFLFNQDSGMCMQCSGLGYQYGANFSENSQLMDMSIEEIIDDLTQDGYDFFKMLDPLFDKWAIDLTTPLVDLKPKQLNFFLNGSDDVVKGRGFSFRYRGLNRMFELLSKSSKGSIKEVINSMMDQVSCPFCKGQRLNSLALNVRIGKSNIADVAHLPIQESLEFIEKIELSSTDATVLREVMKQLKDRLTFLSEIGVGYLSLDRSAPTLSGGELQRIRLSRQIGSKLTGVLYVLDEPTIGLHPIETEKLKKALYDLQKLGNTLVIVEHEKAIMQMASQIYDMGPGSGEFGGHLIAQGSLEEIKKSEGPTGPYLAGTKTITIEPVKEKQEGAFAIQEASKHNLKNISCSIPIGKITGLIGPSGSGKSTLMHHIIKTAFKKRVMKDAKGIVDLGYGKVEVGDHFKNVISFDQRPNFHTTRADIASFCDLLTPLRGWFAKLPEAQARGLEPRYFSYYHKKGACPTCFGFGYKTINLQLMPSVKITCPDCHGNRLNPLALSITYKGKHLADYLKMSPAGLLEHFDHIPKVKRILETLIKTGLGYVRLKQEIHTLSGGEAGRLRLATELAKRQSGKNLYLFDEPTIGLHFSDIEKLIKIFFELKEKGHTVLIVEHNTDVIGHLDHVVELGPTGGKEGGTLLFEGNLEEMRSSKESQTFSFI